MGNPCDNHTVCIPPQSRAVWKGLQWDSSALQQRRRSHLPPPQRHPWSDLHLSRSQPKISRSNPPLLMVKSMKNHGKSTCMLYACTILSNPPHVPIYIHFVPTKKALLHTATKGPKILPASWLPTAVVPHPSAALQRCGAPTSQRHPGAPHAPSCASFDGWDW